MRAGRLRKGSAEGLYGRLGRLPRFTSSSGRVTAGQEVGRVARRVPLKRLLFPQ